MPFAARYKDDDAAEVTAAVAGTQQTPNSHAAVEPPAVAMQMDGQQAQIGADQAAPMAEEPQPEQQQEPPSGEAQEAMAAQATDAAATPVATLTPAASKAATTVSFLFWPLADLNKDL
jgi:hypothetical protein